jgi:hypothetical protein
MKKLLFLFFLSYSFKSFAQINSVSDDYKTKDGILYFKSLQIMNEYIEKYSKLSNLEQKKIDSKNKVISLHSIYSDIIEKEDALEGDYMKKNKVFKGAKIPHSVEYRQALLRGNIIETPDTLNSISVDLNICFQNYKYVLNSDRLVIIADTIYQFSKNNFKTMPYKNKEEFKIFVNTNEPNIKLGINVFNLSNSKSTQQKACGSNCIKFDWSRKSIWVYISNKTRVMHKVDGTACGNCTCGPWSKVIFYYEFDAQRKNFFGNWVNSNQFTPNFSMNGSWQYDSEATNNNNDCLHGYTANIPCPGSSPNPPNSFSGTAFGFSRNYCPHGTWVLSIGNWVSVPHVTSMIFTCIVNGTTTLPVLN